MPLGAPSHRAQIRVFPYLDSHDFRIPHAARAPSHRAQIRVFPYLDSHDFRIPPF